MAWWTSQRSRYRIRVNRWMTLSRKRVCNHYYSSNVSISPEDTVQWKKTWSGPSSGFGDPPEDATVPSCWSVSTTLKVISFRWKLELLNKGVTLIPEKRLSYFWRLSTTAHMYTNVGSDAPTTKENFSGRVLDRAGIEKIQLAAKEGLALINGTTVPPVSVPLRLMMVSTTKLLISLVLSHGKFTMTTVHSEKTFHSSVRGHHKSLATSVTFLMKQEYHCCDSTTGTDPYTLLYPQIHGQQGFYCLRKRKVEIE